MSHSSFRVPRMMVWGLCEAAFRFNTSLHPLLLSSFPFYRRSNSKEHSPRNLRDTDPYFRFCFLGNSTSDIRSPSHNITHPGPCSNRPCSQWLSVFELYQLWVWMSEPSHLAHAPTLWWHWLWQMDSMAHKPKYLLSGALQGKFSSPLSSWCPLSVVQIFPQMEDFISTFSFHFVVLWIFMLLILYLN